MTDEIETGLEQPRGEECQVCRKRSDAAKKLHGFTLCGTHYDEVLGLLVRTGLATERARSGYVAGYVRGERARKYAACWAAEGT